MESWRRTWREGFLPLISTEALEGLAHALRTDDKRLIQGSTTTPPPLQCVEYWPVEAACALGYCGWIWAGGGCPGPDNTATVGEVEEFFARACFECDQRLGEPGGCRWFLNAWDETPRAEMFPMMLAEVELALAGRRGPCSASA